MPHEVHLRTLQEHMMDLRKLLREASEGDSQLELVGFRVHSLRHLAKKRVLTISPPVFLLVGCQRRMNGLADALTVQHTWPTEIVIYARHCQGQFEAQRQC